MLLASVLFGAFLCGRFENPAPCTINCLVPVGRPRFVSRCVSVACHLQNPQVSCQVSSYLFFFFFFPLLFTPRQQSAKRDCRRPRSRDVGDFLWLVVRIHKYFVRRGCFVSSLLSSQDTSWGGSWLSLMDLLRCSPVLVTTLSLTSCFPSRAMTVVKRLAGDLAHACVCGC